MLIVNIRRIYMIVEPGVERLAGHRMADAPATLDDAWLLIRKGKIADFGQMADISPELMHGQMIVDARGGLVIPSFCDSHTHIIYAGSREGEFVDRIRGLSYEEIAARGGGILNSADRLAATDEQTLFDASMSRLNAMVARGTGAVEVKTGYGLTTDAEMKMLRVAARLREEAPIPVKITFLGAHAVGRAYAGRQGAYVDMLIGEMLPAIAAEGVADYVDVFCDAGFFTVDETARILDAAARYGMRPKIHANELAASGGVQTGVAHHAVSVDHLERIGDAEIDCLRGSTTVATMLPGASFFLGMPYAPARQAVDAGLTVALASDYNPGSSPSGDMRMVWTLACTHMGLTPAEALTALTLNGAAAMEMGVRCGAIGRGRDARLIITKPMPSIDCIPYEYTADWIARHIIQA